MLANEFSYRRHMRVITLFQGRFAKANVFFFKMERREARDGCKEMARANRAYATDCKKNIISIWQLGYTILFARRLFFARWLNE